MAMAKEGKCRRCHQWTMVNSKGYCPRCASDRVVEAVKQLREKKGYFYQKWRKGLKASLEKGSK